jgi:hypothetical protein
MTRVSRKNKKGLSDRRKTRRQQQQKQKGAGQIDSVDAWIKAVLKTRPFDPQNEDKFMKHPNEDNQALRLGKYNIGDLVDDQLKLPPKEKDANGLFLVNNLNSEFQLFENDINDFRDIAVSLRYSFSDIINNPDLTPYEFLKHIKDLKENPNQDSTVIQLLEYAEDVEARLQQKAKNDPTLQPFDILTNELYYPLFILTLIVNTDGDEIPILLSETELDAQIAKASGGYQTGPPSQ